MKIWTRQILNLINKLKLEKIMIRLSTNKYFKKNFWDFGGYNHYENIYQGYKELLKKGNIKLKNKKILEIGSGNSIGVGYFFTNEDYSEWWASDFNRNPFKNKSSLKKEVEFINVVKDRKNIKLEIPRLLNKKLKFINLDLSKFKPELKSKFDLILSNAVLEHIPKNLIKKSIENMYLYLKKGGIMIHQIDLRDHTNVLNPFNFYKYSDEEWEKITKNSIFYTNRLRAIDYIKLFNKILYKKVYVHKYPKFPNRIHPNFIKNYRIKELSASSINLIIKNMKGH
jgi:hypothetical protein